MQDYIKALDKDIKDMINQETKRLTTKGEEMLHVLFENRKHAMKMHEEMSGETMGASSAKSAY